MLLFRGFLGRSLGRLSTLEQLYESKLGGLYPTVVQGMSCLEDTCAQIAEQSMSLALSFTDPSSIHPDIIHAHLATRIPIDIDLALPWPIISVARLPNRCKRSSSQTVSTVQGFATDTPDSETRTPP